MVQQDAVQFKPQTWSLRWIQARRLIAMEIRRNLFSRKAGWIYFLAYIPTLIILVHLFVDRGDKTGLSEDTKVLAVIMQLYYVRLGIFFGCLGIFSRLIRGEMIERSLHFYLLAPVSREILLLSKFAAGSVSALFLFLSATIANFVLMYSKYGSTGSEFVFSGPGLAQLGSYLLIITLGCLGYGAVFLLFSMVFRNPMPAALVLLGWESINPVLPSLLQRLSVASYLRHLMPVQISPEGFMAMLTVQTTPLSGLAATCGLLFLIATVLAYSCYRMRRLEIRYVTE